MPKQREDCGAAPCWTEVTLALMQKRFKGDISEWSWLCHHVAHVSRLVLWSVCAHSLAESMLLKSPLQDCVCLPLFFPPVVFLLRVHDCDRGPTVLVQHSSFPLWNSRGVMWIRKYHGSLLECREENRVKFIYSFFWWTVLLKTQVNEKKVI